MTADNGETLPLARGSRVCQSQASPQAHENPFQYVDRRPFRGGSDPARRADAGDSILRGQGNADHGRNVAFALRTASKICADQTRFPYRVRRNRPNFAPGFRPLAFQSKCSRRFFDGPGFRATAGGWLGRLLYGAGKADRSRLCASFHGTRCSTACSATGPGS